MNGDLSEGGAAVRPSGVDIPSSLVESAVTGFDVRARREHRLQT